MSEERKLVLQMVADGKVYASSGETRPGQVGDGAGSIRVSVNTGDIRLQH